MFFFAKNGLLNRRFFHKGIFCFKNELRCSFSYFSKSFIHISHDLRYISPSRNNASNLWKAQASENDIDDSSRCFFEAQLDDLKPVEYINFIQNAFSEVLEDSSNYQLFWSNCEERAVRLIEENFFNVPDLAIILYIFNSLKIEKYQVQTKIVERLGQNDLQNIPIEDLSVIIRTISDGKFRDKVLIMKMAKSIVDKCKLSQGTSFSITNFLWAYSKLVIDGDCELYIENVEVCLKVLCKNFSYFTYFQIAEIMESLALLRIRDMPFIQESLQILATKLIEDFRDKSLVENEINEVDCRDKLSYKHVISIIFSYAKCKVGNMELFELSSQLLNNQDVLRSLDVAEITKIVYSIGKFCNCINSSFLDYLALQIRKNLRTFDLNELSQILISFARMGYKVPILLNRTASMLKRSFEIQKDLIRVKSYSIVNLAMGFAKFLFCDQKLFLILSSLLQSPCYSSLNSAETDIQCQPELMDKSDFRTHIDVLDNIDLLNILIAWSKVRIIDVDLFENVTSLMERRNILKIPNLSFGYLLKYLVACAKLQYRCAIFQKKVVSLINDRFPLQSLGMLELLKLSDAVNTLRIDFKPLEDYLSTVFPAEINVKNDTSKWTRECSGPVISRKRNLRSRKSAKKRKWCW